MRKFRTSKRFWLILIALIAIGVFVYFVLLDNIPEETVEEELPEEVRKDKIPPSTAILSPEDKSWWNSDFEITINDSDIGAGLIDFFPGEKGCQYLIVDLGTDRVRGGFRKCDPVKINVPVGPDKTCSSSYSKDNISLGKCKVSTKAFDKANNNSGWKSKVFNIDLIKPQVKEIVINQGLEINQEHLFESTASDNSKVTGCWFYVNGKLIDTPVLISPIPCENENQCDISLKYSFEKEGDFSVRFGCSDIAGNVGFGEAVNVKITTNHPPLISFCRANPTQGTNQTDFRFEVQASDPDEDILSYLWDFGDSKTSSEQNPIHSYDESKIFRPKVLVSDNRGEESECSTAWVTVSQNQ
ncbi:MAG: PKD domain-containing protein [Patescibacteria group bacterium]|nr:PKD domain-containing protein [Patescibacteria group bacterium]